MSKYHVENEIKKLIENARVGDRVYSPLFKCKNTGDKTNAEIIDVWSNDVEIVPDVLPENIKGTTFKNDGSYIKGGGQVLFWIKPIHEIPTRPKRKVMKEGWIGIMPVTNKNIIAYTTGIYDTTDGRLSTVDKSYKVQQIQFEVEE